MIIMEYYNPNVICDIYAFYAIMHMLNGRYRYGGCSYLPGAINNDCNIKSFATISPTFRTCHELPNPLDNTKIMYAEQ